MIFNLVLKYIFKANTEADKLRASVIYGWTLAIVGFLSLMLGNAIAAQSSDVANNFLTVTIVTLALFIMRYTSVKPLLGAAAGGITVVALATIIEGVFNRRDNAFSLGALTGVLLVLFFMIIKNIVVSWYYLIKETYRFYQYKKNNEVLDETVLSNYTAPVGSRQ